MPTVQGEPSALQCFGRDLTALARDGQFAPLEGYESWVNRVFETLMRPPTWRNNPLLIGRSEAEGWSIVAEVVRRIARGEVPADLRVRRVVALEWDAVVRDLPDAGEAEVWAAPEHRFFTEEERAADTARWKRILGRTYSSADPVEREGGAAPSDPLDDPIHQRLEAVFADVRRSEGRVLLYVEQLHRLVRGEQEPYPVDMHDLLKPALARGELPILGTCSVDAYREYIERDLGMQRRFQEILSPELSRSLGRDGV
jgi:ATP-dependent Clp protease ATP-binding subunit ClpB